MENTGTSTHIELQSLAQALAVKGTRSVFTVIDAYNRCVYSVASTRSPSSWVASYEARGYDVVQTSMDYVEISGGPGLTVLIFRGSC